MRVIDYIEIIKNICVICVSILIILAMIFRITHFNIWIYIKNYLKIFKKDEKFDCMALSIAFILPLFIALYIQLTKGGCESDYNDILVVVTILSALYFSLLGLIIDIKKNITEFIVRILMNKLIF